MSSAPIRPDSTPRIALFARWAAPMTGALIENAALLIEGDRISAVGRKRELEIPAGAERIDLEDAILLPGLVNAHTHLELSLIERPAFDPRHGFIRWLQHTMSQMPVDPAQREKHVMRAAREGVRQCLKFGVTWVGDISRRCDLTRAVLKKSRMGGVSFGEVLAMAQSRGLLDERIAAAVNEHGGSERLRIGISPHAPYSIEAEGFRRCLTLARDRGLPLATHLAENPFEAEFLADHTGPFRELWAWLDRWDDDVPRFDAGPIRFAQALGLLDYPTLLAHVNYATDDELEILARGRASIVLCPRTHAYFQHPPHRWEEMRKRGINVALGTDGCSSAGDLNLMEDMRLLYQQQPDTPPAALFEMATTCGATALMAADEAGSLKPGKWADVIAVPAHGTDPLRSILESQALPQRVWIGGEEIAGQA